MNKPIEAGCRAVIVNSIAGNNGVVVKVLEDAGVSHFFGGGIDGYYTSWIVDKYLPSIDGDMGNEVPENQLRRIDDYDGNDIVSWDDMKDIWQPERVEEVVL